MDIGAVIMKKRKELGITQAVLAENLLLHILLERDIHIKGINGI